MAVPVSFFHLDNATVDLCWGAEDLLLVLLEGVEQVPAAKMKGFGLISELFHFFDIKL